MATKRRRRITEDEIRRQALRVARKMLAGQRLTPSHRCDGLAGEIGMDGSGKPTQHVSVQVMTYLFSERWAERKGPYYDEWLLADAGREAAQA